ncbi:MULTISPECIES: anaerobic glycerol-3-phosphate dehydrogenase subunit A [Prevotellaceae]|uniref:anaerobic glycerol-3-phosphate dehydrogenase subunit A n=1 Tax=Prevotellaceae TaxID=171552 RepID=UPI00041500A3|nr:anaerobic glycerol-3-phosphate dehydrogenase subunit A [Prevotella phocaeensis]
MNKDINKHYDVIIIGGGITGAGTARDCALRGLRVLLVEKLDFTNGATGRNHGLLHSGARYAVTDKESATECIRENMILRKIARHCIEETDGLFITLPEDDISYQATFVKACTEAGIKAITISPEEARRIEPAVNPDLIGAVRVPDASVDPFFLTTANILDARQHGAEALTYHEVTALIIENGRAVGVKLRNNRTGEVSEKHAEVIINAAGIWGNLITNMAGIQVNMFPAKGTLLIFGHRVNNMVINRCRKPANADILVPDDTVCVIGTTSDRVPIETIDNLQITPEEVDTLIKEGEKLAPNLATTRILRAYAGVRPLVAADNDPSGRSISRGIVCLDHEIRDGLAGLITITGGKMMTYRLMAEKATDLACKKLGVTKICETATTPLPGSQGLSSRESSKKYTTAHNAASGRQGHLAQEISASSDEDKALVCECEEVSVGEVKYAMDKLHVHNLINLRRRTRTGMGTCQSELCACRAAGVMCSVSNNPDETLADLGSFVNERWKGMRPVAWGRSLDEAQLMATIYEGLCGIDAFANRKEISK